MFVCGFVFWLGGGVCFVGGSTVKGFFVFFTCGGLRWFCLTDLVLLEGVVVFFVGFFCRIFFFYTPTNVCAK